MTTAPDRPGWPRDVSPITVGDLKRLGIDGGNALYWDGKRVEVRTKLRLTRAQQVLALVVSMFAILGGLGGFLSGVQNLSLFLCARGVHVLGCAPS